MVRKTSSRPLYICNFVSSSITIQCFKGHDIHITHLSNLDDLQEHSLFLSRAKTSTTVFLVVLLEYFRAMNGANLVSFC